MAQENITIILPVSGKTAVIKPFISHKVAREIQNLIIGDKKLDPENKSFATEVEITGADGIKMNEVLVNGLLISLDGRSERLEEEVDELSEEDYGTILDAASNVYQEYIGKTEKKELPAGNKNTSKA